MKLKVLIPAMMAACCIATSNGLAQDVATARTLAVPHLTVHVLLTKNYAGQPMLVENFFTDDPQHHSVYCVSGFFDVHYVLKSPSGNVVPISRHPNGSDMVQGGGGTAPGVPDQCKTVRVSRNQRRVLISSLYHDLAHGTYSLQVTLAARGMTAHAAAEPIVVKI